MACACIFGKMNDEDDEDGNASDVVRKVDVCNNKQAIDANLSSSERALAGAHTSPAPDDDSDKMSTPIKTQGRGKNKCIRIIHFNDVYTINNETGKPGGAARFTTLLRQRAKAEDSACSDGLEGGNNNEMNADMKSEPSGEALVLFSGDVFSPSLEGNLFKVYIMSLI